MSPHEVPRPILGLPCKKPPRQRYIAEDETGRCGRQVIAGRGDVSRATESLREAS